MAPIRTLLIANRGEIACRIIRTARRMGIATVAVHSDADAEAPHVHMADRAVGIGPAPVAESYLRGDRIIEAARVMGADAIHPGYGFLSENAEFAQDVVDAGLVWVGPPPAAIRAMGLKGEAKRLMEEAGVPVVPGYHGDAQDEATLRQEAERIGYPVLIKAVAGGGGKGMRAVERAEDFADALASAKREGANAFGNDRVLIERLVQSPRHIEVQVLADTHGRAISLGTRDCSLQRRHQKVIEEAPAPGLSPAIARAFDAAAVRGAEAVGYTNAGTIEFIADGAVLAEALHNGSDHVPDGAFSFMEMNTRLQVEHPVTEEVTGHDLVEWQLRVAMGEALPDPFDPPSKRASNAHAVEARLYAEDVPSGFLPATGTLHHLRLPALATDGRDVDTDEHHQLVDGRARVDAGVREGGTVSPHYDPMIAKVIGIGADRTAAIDTLIDALHRTEVAGLVTNRDFLIRLLDDPSFRAAELDTGLIGRRSDALAADPKPGILERSLAAMAAWGMLPPTPHAGFRLWARARSYLALRRAGEPADVTIVGPNQVGVYAAEVDDDQIEFAIRHMTDPSHRSGTAGSTVETISVVAEMLEGRGRQPVHATIVLHPSERLGERAVTLQTRESTHRFVVPDPLAASSAGAAGGDAVLAPMPGTLIALEIAEGDAVEAGQRLAVLEAMKMEHSLKAPRAGTVAQVTGAVGSSVAAGDAIVLLEAE